VGDIRIQHEDGPGTGVFGLDDMIQSAKNHRDGPEKTATRRRRLRRRLLITLGLFTALIGLAAGIGVVTFFHMRSALDSNIERFGDPFEAIPEESRPTTEAEATGAVNILLLGSDSRVSAGDPTQWSAGAQRTDAIMVLHISADRDSASIMSIPRDSWVQIPGHGMNKINAGFSFGGPTLMVQTIESVTGVRIDHVAIVDFDGFKEITDALGGVTITVPKTVSSFQGTIEAGTYTMDGETALTYVRQRYNLPGGDFDRVRRQQNWIRAVMNKLMSGGTLKNPVKLNNALSALTKSLATDDDFTIEEMQSLAVSLRSLRSDDVDFFTVPVQGTGWSPDHTQSIVVLDEQADEELFEAIRTDDVRTWLTANDIDELGTTVR
jgi:LCP family protein required for cell wall assembly